MTKSNLLEKLEARELQYGFINTVIGIILMLEIFPVLEEALKQMKPTARRQFIDALLKVTGPNA